MDFLFKNKKNIKKGIFTLFLLLVAVSMMPINVSAETDVADVAEDFLTNVAQQGGVIQDPQSAPTAAQLIGIKIKTILNFVGVIFFILVIYGGIIWMTASGNEEQVQKAVKIFKGAVIGIIVVILAYLLTNYVVFKISDLNQISEPTIEEDPI